ncbi:MAG: BON domain-containing protein, partial [Desulfatirhabdiaceae bacterium]
PQIVLQNVPGILKVRIVAPTRWRAEKIAALRKISLEEATAVVDKLDLSRRALMESVYGMPLYIWIYDLSINIQTFTLETAAGFVCNAVTEMNDVPEEAALKERLICLALAAHVESAIKKEIQISPYREFEVTATAEGQINLEGAVHDKHSKTQAEKIAGTVKGVSFVVNRLKTTDIGFS